MIDNDIIKPIDVVKRLPKVIERVPATVNFYYSNAFSHPSVRAYRRICLIITAIP